MCLYVANVFATSHMDLQYCECKSVIDRQTHKRLISIHQRRRRRRRRRRRKRRRRLGAKKALFPSRMSMTSFSGTGCQYQFRWIKLQTQTAFCVSCLISPYFNNDFDRDSFHIHDRVEAWLNAGSEPFKECTFSASFQKFFLTSVQARILSVCW